MSWKKMANGHSVSTKRKHSGTIPFKDGRLTREQYEDRMHMATASQLSGLFTSKEFNKWLASGRSANLKLLFFSLVVFLCLFAIFGTMFTLLQPDLTLRFDRTLIFSTFFLDDQDPKKMISGHVDVQNTERTDEVAQMLSDEPTPEPATDEEFEEMCYPWDERVWELAAEVDVLRGTLAQFEMSSVWKLFWGPLKVFLILEGIMQFCTLGISSLTGAMLGRVLKQIK